MLSKQVLDRGVAPLTLLVIELAASSLLLLVFMLGLRKRWNRHAGLGRLALLGILNPGLAYALGLLGLVTVSASLSVLLWGTEPVLIVILAVLVLRERVAAAALLGIAVALVGVLLVVYRPGVAGDATGVILTAVAVTACAGYTVLTRRLLLDDSSLLVALVQQAAALAFAVVVAASAAGLGIAEPDLPATVSTWLLAGLSGAVYYGFAFWFYVSGLRGVPAATAGAFLPLIPVFGLAFASLTGEGLLARQWWGAAMVVVAAAAIAIHQLARTGEADEDSNQVGAVDRS